MSFLFSFLLLLHCDRNDIISLLFLYFISIANTSDKEILSNRTERIGGYSEEVPPLTIPNREVKLLSADGTAKAGE